MKLFYLILASGALLCALSVGQTDTPEVDRDVCAEAVPTSLSTFEKQIKKYLDKFLIAKKRHHQQLALEKLTYLFEVQHQVRENTLGDEDTQALVKSLVLEKIISDEMVRDIVKLVAPASLDAEVISSIARMALANHYYDGEAAILCLLAGKGPNLDLEVLLRRIFSAPTPPEMGVELISMDRFREFYPAASPIAVLAAENSMRLARSKGDTSSFTEDELDANWEADIERKIDRRLRRAPKADE